MCLHIFHRWQDYALILPSCSYGHYTVSVCVVWSSGLSLMTSSCTMTSHITQNNTVGVIIKNIDYCFSWITTSRECTYFHVPTSSKDLEDLNTLSPLCSSFYTLIIQLETSRFRCSLQLWSLEGGSCGVNQTSWNIQRRALQDPSPCWNCLLVFSL